MERRPMPIRLLLADDNLDFLCSLRSMLQRSADIVVVAEAVSGPEAVALALTHRPDVSLLDVRMPGFSGIEAARQICEHWREAVVILLSMNVENAYLAEAARAGALGYLAKTVNDTELVESIRLAVSGGTCFTSSSTGQ